jgi:hypothetical protein
LKPGEAFVSLTPGSPPHTWIFVSNPDRDGAVVMFNMSSAFPGCDRSCVIMPGEYPLVEHETVIMYMRGRLLAPAQWRSLQNLGIRPAPPVTEMLLRRIQEGSLASMYTKEKYKNMIRDSM